MLLKIKISKRGFTLLEMIITVAIIAILVVIAIPIFSNVLSKSKEATCAANRRSLMSVLTYTYIDEDSDAVQGKYNSVISQYKCPKGGEITYHLDGENIVTVTCSVHNSPINIITNGLNKHNIDLESVKRFDSTNPKTSDLTSSLGKYFLDCVTAAGAKTEGANSINPKSWVVVKTNDGGDVKYGSDRGTLLIWSDRDINSYNSSSEVKTPAICYNVSNGRYTVGLSNVTKLNNNNYYTLAQSAEKDGFAGTQQNKGKNFATYEEAKKYYDELASKY